MMRPETKTLKLRAVRRDGTRTPAAKRAALKRRNARNGKAALKGGPRRAR